MANHQRVTYVAIRDSADLGLDKGTICHVLRTKGAHAQMDLEVPSLDMTISGVPFGHPDLALHGARGMRGRSNR